MTKWEAAKKLESVMDNWLDFDYWAYLQLIMRDEWSQECMAEVLENHKKAEEHLNAFRTEIGDQGNKMRERGAGAAEINAYFRSRDGELQKLVTAWRSLDGLSG